jgi:hypothetical protein
MTITASVLADCQCLSFLAWLPPQIAFRPIRASGTRNAPHSRVRRVGGSLKDASPFSSQTIQIFIHPFSSFPPLNAIKKIAHTPAARIRSTTKVCIFKISFLFQHSLMASQSIGLHGMVNRRALHPEKERGR